MSEDEDLIMQLLDMGIDLNLKNKNEDTFLGLFAGVTPSKHKSLIMKELLDRGSDPYIKNVYGKTFLELLLLDEDRKEMEEYINSSYCYIKPAIRK